MTTHKRRATAVPSPETGFCAAAPPVAPLERRVDLELVAAGWQRRHSVERARADESVALYRALGLEVMTRPPARREFGPGCESCADVACRDQVVVYTRAPCTTGEHGGPALGTSP